MQFAVVAIFANLLPACSLICFLINIVKLKALKHEFHYKQRFFPDLAFGIGAFLGILEFISFLAVIVNVMIAYLASLSYKRLAT